MKHYKQLLVLLSILAVLLGVTACGEEPAPEAAVKSLVLVSEPDKAAYEEGEMFDSTGLIVNAVYTDEHIEENVAFKVKTKDALTPHTKSVTITYGGKTLPVEITVSYKGNNQKYSVGNTPPLESSPLRGSVFYFLGSSVTFGQMSDGEAMGDYLAKRTGCVSIKEAVSGTTLADIEDISKGDSYVKRLEAYIASADRAEHLDAFICQLSTNDMYNLSTLGTLTEQEITDKSQFDKATTYGAMEYIVALVQETWHCPVVFYTNSYFENDTYAAMVRTAEELAQKWSCVSVLNLYEDSQFNDITQELRSLYMADDVHPTKAGYLVWWLPKFEEHLQSVTEQ